MADCNRCDNEILNCENCAMDIVKEADRLDIRCSPDGHFCSLDCSLGYFEIEKARLPEGV